MRVLVVGAGGVGSAILPIAARRDFIDTLVLADIDAGRARAAVDRTGWDRAQAAQVDASSQRDVAALASSVKADVVVNACDPRFNMPIFDAALAAGADYLDMAMSLSTPHPSAPYAEPGVKLGDEQFAADARWRAAGRLALVGMGVEPGMSDVFARHAADTM